MTLKPLLVLTDGGFSFFHFFLDLCSVYVCTKCLPAEARRGHHIPWNSAFSAELNLGPLEKQPVLLQLNHLFSCKMLVVL